MQDDDTDSMQAVTHAQDLKLSASDTPSNCLLFSLCHRVQKSSPLELKKQNILFKHCTGYSQQLDVNSPADIPTFNYSHMLKLDYLDECRFIKHNPFWSQLTAFLKAF